MDGAVYSEPIMSSLTPKYQRHLPVYYIMKAEKNLVMAVEAAIDVLCGGGGGHGREAVAGAAAEEQPLLTYPSN